MYTQQHSQSFASQPAPRILAGAYELLAHVASGGMGAIHRARRVEDGATVAVKTLHQRLMNNDEAVQRFEREVEAIRRLTHPDIVSALDHGHDRATDQMYLVMEWLDGQDLQQLLESQGPLAPRDAAWIALRITRCLAFAHARKVIHRDLKPENIFLTRGADGEVCVKILDFGLAKILDDESLARITCMGEVCGTPAFMSPEQARGEALDGRSDIYALGCVLFNMLTGAAPFEGDNPLKVMSMHQLEPLPPLPRSVPAMLARVVLQATAKSRRKRYPTAALMGAALRAFLTHGARTFSSGAAPAAAPQEPEALEGFAGPGTDRGPALSAATGPRPAQVQTRTEPGAARAGSRTEPGAARAGSRTEPGAAWAGMRAEPVVARQTRPRPSSATRGAAGQTRPRPSSATRGAAHAPSAGAAGLMESAQIPTLIAQPAARRPDGSQPAPREAVILGPIPWNPGAPPRDRDRRDAPSLTTMLAVVFLVLAGALTVISLI